jgi:protein arginine N-methyltransferase 1
VDLCVSEIIGNIGSSEGVMAVLNDARRRFLTPNGIMIPSRCDTNIAAVALPDLCRVRPKITRNLNIYCNAIFNLYGRRFDPRLALVISDGGVADIIISTEARVERLDFSGFNSTEYKTPFELEIVRSGHIDGFVCWIQLWTTPEFTPIDSRSTDNWSWPMAFIPGVDLDAQQGDLIKGLWYGNVSDDGVNMDYRISGLLRQRDGKEITFEADGRHHPSVFQNSRIHRVLFAKSSELPIFEGWPKRSSDLSALPPLNAVK